MLTAISFDCIADMEFVRIGQTGNPPNRFGYGSVNYEYEIGKYEVTNSEYCRFLNAVAGETDVNNLFSPMMEQHFFGGIIRIATGNSYRYECKPGYENRPVAGVTWMSAIRYVNWLNYNAENIHKGIPLDKWYAETEGNDDTGSYNTSSVPEHRNENAVYWLPNRSEWEKAAYYDKEFWYYGISDNANCFNPVTGWAMAYPHMAVVGLSEGPNGTFDQQGNVAEWVESSSGGWKFALGGSAIRPAEYALCGTTEADDPYKSISTFGFRICRAVNVDYDEPVKYPDEFAIPENDKTDTIKIIDANGTCYVKISDPGNKGDIVNQYKGAVHYAFYIARTELTNSEYCRFLNAVAVKSDPYGLYNENMGSSVCGGISRTVSADGYAYRCNPGWENKPVVYVHYYDIARYCNWMHFGCPTDGVSEIGTTEGNRNTGAYDTSDFENVRAGRKPPYKSFGKRNEGAKFWIPDENEWYKAAYYDPNLTGGRKYHDYPTMTSDPPGQAQANYMSDNRLAIGPPYYLCDVDSYASAQSYYGTLQQGGNVWEWIESWQYGVVGNRGLKGGSWSYTAFGLNACNTDPGGIDNMSYVFGARICKSCDDSGWHPVPLPLGRRIYETIMLLPKSRILALSMLTALCLISMIVYFIVKNIKRICGKSF